MPDMFFFERVGWPVKAWPCPEGGAGSGGERRFEWPCRIELVHGQYVQLLLI